MDNTPSLGGADIRVERRRFGMILPTAVWSKRRCLGGVFCCRSLLKTLPYSRARPVFYNE